MSALKIFALIAAVLEAQLVVAGKVGCNYDDTLCEGTEVCVNDALFGVCIMESFARDARVAELNHAINERLMADKARGRELRVLLTFLVRAGYNWRSPFTQCVVDSFRVSVISQSPAQYGLCVGVTESRTGELTSRFPDDEMLDSSDEGVDEDNDELATQLEAAKRDEEVSVHKYFKKLDADGERREEAAREVDDLLSLSNEDLAHRIAQLRRQITVQLYQDEVKRAASDEDSGSDSDDSDDMRNRAMLLSLVNKMKERVRARLERLEPHDSARSRYQSDEDESENERGTEADFDNDASQSAENVEQLGESAMRASTGAASNIVVDKKQDSSDADVKSRTPTNSPFEPDPVDNRYGVIELADSLTSFAAEAAFDKIVDTVNWQPSACLQFVGVAGEANNALRFRMRQDCESDSATQFLDTLWNNRDLVKTATQYDVVLVATGKDKLHVLNATQRASEEDANGELLITIIVCAVVLCVVLIAVIAFIVCTMVRRRRKQSELDKSLLLGGSDAPETYGELCRQRMTASANEKLEAIPVPVRSLFGRSKIFAARSSPPPSKTSPDRSQVNSTSSSNAWMDEPLQTNMDITTGHAILSYMEAFLRNPEKLELEWQGLSEYEADRKAISVGQRDENVSKNRHPALLPYDHNRVVLTNYLGGDYVNASFVADHDPRSPAYIATQSPLPETATDFWQMVWEHGGNILVNLVSSTGRSADGNNNAAGQAGTSDADYRYWPSEGMEIFGSLELHLVSEHLVCDDYVVRNFYLKNAVTNETRTITQFHFVSWTEHGVPSIRSLLEFRRKVIKSHHHGKSKPIVVHCSDGCGRTGTYCLVDLVLNRIAKGTVKEVDVGATIEHLRDQRVSMVKTKKQFEFALMAIADEVNAVLKALAAQQTKS